MKYAPTVYVLLLLCSLLNCQTPPAPKATPPPSALPDCEWCGAMDAPADVDATLQIAGPEEPGDRLLITGTVFQSDSLTPAPGILLYAYHTNQSGVYARKGNETGNGRRHGHLRGWLKTDENGQFRIETIRPGTYPSRNEPAHIHFTVSGPKLPEYWLPALVFADDPLLNAGQQAQAEDGSPFSPVIQLKGDAKSGWQGVYHIVLKDLK